jgi:hypothetical protein
MSVAVSRRAVVGAALRRAGVRAARGGPDPPGGWARAREILGAPEALGRGDAALALVETDLDARRAREVLRSVPTCPVEFALDTAGLGMLLELALALGPRTPATNASWRRAGAMLARGVPPELVLLIVKGLPR